MNCDPLPRTGPDDLGLILIVAIACVVVGAVLVAMTRKRRRAPAVLVVVLLVGAALAFGPGAAAPAVAAPAVPAHCVAGGDNSLTVTQTSTMEGLAPGVAPVPITGRVVNNGTDGTYVDTVTVEITAVTTERGGPADCAADDYLLLDTTMAVGRALGPDGGSAPFSGASVGFADKDVNQDACQRATVHLRYTANPGAQG